MVVFQTRWSLWGGGGLGTGTVKGCSVPGVWGSVRGVISNNINQTQCLYFASEAARVCSKSLGHGTLLPNLQRGISNSSPAWRSNALGSETASLWMRDTENTECLPPQHPKSGLLRL